MHFGWKNAEALDIIHRVERIVMLLVKNAATGSKLFFGLPVVCTQLKYESIFRHRRSVLGLENFELGPRYLSNFVLRRLNDVARRTENSGEGSAAFTGGRSWFDSVGSAPDFREEFTRTGVLVG